jgi:threonine-phosphate decarboxylase
MIVIPGFAEYRRALQTVDCEVVEYALRERDGWQLTDAILDALTPALDCLFLCTPNNPTGLLPERGLLEAIAQRCRALNISLILDEAFLDFIPDQPGFIPAGAAPARLGSAIADQILCHSGAASRLPAQR